MFKEYRREYKRHFAWIRAGKLSAVEFAAWSKRAQAKKKDCDNKKISLDEFKEWLGQRRCSGTASWMRLAVRNTPLSPDRSEGSTCRSFCTGGLGSHS